MSYAVADLFHSIQGEGHFVGYPMTFVRLAGCGVLDCHIRRECDEAPWKATFTATASEIVRRVRQLKPSGIVCITGGEPSDHDLIPLVDTLTAARYRVHLETSGARAILGLPVEWLTVSPKALSAGGLKQRVGHTLKIVIRPEWSASEAWSIIRSLDADTNFLHRYLQPLTVDEKAVNLDAVIAMVTSDENGGGRWALSYQAHRAWSVR